MDTNQILTQAQEYLGKFIDAAVPVAKQAYEIGLLTIRIDALQTIMIGLVIGVVSILMLRWLHSVRIKAMSFAKQVNKERYPNSSETNQLDVAKREWTKYTFFDEPGYFASHLPAFVGLAISAYMLCNIWLWVKLFKPELWLAKQAIMAATEALTK